MEDICKDPKIGEAKSGDLLGFRVFKFRHRKQEYLVAYRSPGDHESRARAENLEAGLIDSILRGHTKIFTRI